jgi:hypothetical protein
MSEPTIICPNCKTEIKLTESLAAPLIESTRRDYEKRLALKDTDIARKEESLREREAAVSQATQAIDDQVAEKLLLERAKIVSEESKKAKLVLQTDIDQKTRELAELQDVLNQRDVKLAEAQKAQADLIRQKRELDDAKRELDLTVETRVQDGLSATREQAKKEAEEGLRLKVMEKEQTIASMQTQIEELKRRAEQGSQQLQGEVQELELEALLRAKFPWDTIEPVPKGEHGGDALQHVVGPNGQPCGTIIWESKRTKNWSDAWLTKLREDQRAAKAEIAVIVSQSLHKEVETFGLVENVWVTHPKTILPVALAPPPYANRSGFSSAGIGRTTDQNGDGLSVPDRTTFPTSSRGNRGSVLLYAGRSRQGKESHHQTVGKARGTDRASDASYCWYVRRPSRDSGEIIAGDRWPEFACAN